jgi:hypothetical protein
MTSATSCRHLGGGLMECVKGTTIQREMSPVVQYRLL